MSLDMHSLVGAYAVDALDRTERALVERHLDECAECREELASFAEVVTAMADAHATAPPLALRSRVMEAVVSTSQLTPHPADARVTSSSGAPPGANGPARRSPAHPFARTSGRRWVPALAGAAASAVLIAVLALGWSPLGGDESGLALEKDVMMVTSAPDAQTADLDLGSGHVVTSDRMEGLALMGAQAPMPEDGMEYQVWLVMEDGSAVPGPTFVPSDGGEYMAVVHMDLGGVTAVCITTEPSGGSEHPTMEPMLEVTI